MVTLAPDPLTVVFNRHYSELLVWCQRRVRDGAFDPAEIVHEAFLRCRRHWSAERASQRCSVAYLYRATRWALLDALRRRRRAVRPGEARALEELAAESPASCMETQEALDSLSPRQRQICDRILAGRPLCSIQQELQLTDGALAVHLSRAKTQLELELGIASN